mgnify:CR=1 FL=1
MAHSEKTIYPRIGEEVIRTTLENGLPVFVVPKKDYRRKYAMFATRYGGMDMRFEKDGQWLDTPAGIAHYLEHKMFDTEAGNALQELAKNGAEPNAFTSNAITCYYFDSTEKFYENLEILLSFVSVPYFTDESVEKEQGIIAQEINMIEDNPEWQVYKRLMQALYHTSPARTSVAGSVESIRQITAQTLYDCHRAFYTPANMCLVVVGDVDTDKVLAAAERILPKTSGPDIPRDHGPAEDLTATKEAQEVPEAEIVQEAPAYTPDMPVEDILKVMTLEQAQEVVVDSGVCRGLTIAEVAKKRPVNLRFYLTPGNKSKDNIVRAAAQLVLNSLQKAG